MKPDWYLDELKHAGPEHLDAEYVAAFDRKSRPDWDEDLTVLRELGLTKSATVIDIGAGTGGFALAAARHTSRVIAIDVSPPMVEVIRGKIRQAVATNVEVVEAGFLSYTHSGPPVDIVYSRNVLHHLPDFWKVVALRRVAALLRPGGILRLRDLVYSFALEEMDEKIEAWLSQGAARPEDGWTRAELAEHVRTEFSTFSWLLEPMLERAGFEVLSHEISASGAFAAFTCRRP